MYPVDLEKIKIDFIKTVKQIKEITYTNFPDLTMPQLLVWMQQSSEEQSKLILLPDIAIEELPAVITAHKALEGAPFCVMHASDAFAKHGPEPGTNYEKGQLQRDFENGDFTVVELLTFSILTLDMCEVAFIEYGYDDNGQIVYKEDPQFLPADIDSGLVTKILVDAFL